MSTRSKADTQKRVVLERTYRAEIEDVWDLWTTKDGIESWWGPEGFRVEVKKLELRPGGELLYLMIADAPEQIAFMKKAGMPIAHEARIKYREVLRNERLVYDHDVDFVPGVPTYAVATMIEMKQVGPEVKLVLTFDAMHDDVWTERATMGWKSELGKLEAALAKRD